MAPKKSGEHRTPQTRVPPARWRLRATPSPPTKNALVGTPETGTPQRKKPNKQRNKQRNKTLTAHTKNKKKEKHLPGQKSPVGWPYPLNGFCHMGSSRTPHHSQLGAGKHWAAHLTHGKKSVAPADMANWVCPCWPDWELLGTAWGLLMSPKLVLVNLDQMFVATTGLLDLSIDHGLLLLALLLTSGIAAEFIATDNSRDTFPILSRDPSF